MSRAPACEGTLVDSASVGDADAYAALIEPLRPEVYAHCRRMLGCEHDAEDACQEAMMRAWRSLAGFEGRSSLRSWLYRITTNACLNLIEKQRRPRNAFTTLWSDDGAEIVEDAAHGPEERCEQREAAELALAAALERLPERQVSALVVRDVLGFSARDSATALASTEASVNSALQRARARIDGQPPSSSETVTLSARGDAALRETVGRYLDAIEHGDAEAFVGALCPA